MASGDNEPSKLTEEMLAEITDELFGDDKLKPLNTVSQENIQAEYEETKPFVEPEEDTYIETAKAEEVRPAEEKTRKPKRKRSVSIESKSQSLSKLHGELRKHSDARKKTDLAIKNIEKQLKALLLAHHSAIKDLTKQVSRMRAKLSAIEARLGKKIHRYNPVGKEE